MIARNPRTSPRSIEEITRLIESYPVSWRRWCSGPEDGGCACMGCVRQPAPHTICGDPEYAEWPDERDALIEEEVKMYDASMPPKADECRHWWVYPATWDGSDVGWMCAHCGARPEKVFEQRGEALF